jgi:hypothetical protein
MDDGAAAVLAMYKTESGKWSAVAAVPGSSSRRAVDFLQKGREQK